MILVTGYARCGSSSVAYNIGNIYVEAYNDHMIRFDDNNDFRQRVVDAPKENRLELIKREGYRGNKDLFPYIEPYIQQLLDDGVMSRIVVLIRNDLFSQVFSNCMSILMNKWHGDKDFVKRGSVSYIPVDSFNYQLKTCFDYNKKIIKTFKNVPEAKIFTYEDLFTISERQCESWEALFSFLNLPFSSKKLFSINQKRYNSIETMSKIENISELRQIYSEFIYESLNRSESRIVE